MQLSRLTFSLASLVVLLAFGLIFTPMSVMAHPVTTDNNGSGAIHDGDAVGLSHMHPEITVTIADANPNTRAIEVVDTMADEPATPAATDLTPTIEFDVTLTVPVGAQDGGSAVAASSFATTGDITAVAYNNSYLPVGIATNTTGAVAVGAFAQGTLAADGTFTAGATATDRDWRSTFTITLTDVTFTTGENAVDANNPTAAEATAAREAAIAAAITSGIMVDITLDDDLIQTTGLVGGPMAGQGNLMSKTTITVVSATTDAEPGALTGVLANGDYLVVVRDINNPPDFGTADPDLMEWADMPDLHELFIQNTAPGGGGSLQLNLDAMAVDANDMALGTRAVVFTEIMWAVDNRLVGQAGYAANQWFEIHNRSGVDVSHSHISFMAKEGRPALGAGTDLVSNVTGGGNRWIRTKGQNGDSGAADGSGMVAFISMYRLQNKLGEDGANGGHWGKSSQVYKPNHMGTPGDREVIDPQTFTASGVGLTTVFNEIANYPMDDDDGKGYEWIELRIRSGDPHFEKWVVHIVTGADDRDVSTDPTQEKLFELPKLDVNRYDDILLITKTDPKDDPDHPLAAGYNVEVDFAEQKNQGRDMNIRYYVADGNGAGDKFDWTKDLPDDGKFVLILRHNNDRTNHERVEDVAGYHPNLVKSTATFYSQLWPLSGYPAPKFTRNKLEDGAVYRRQKDGIAGTRSGNDKDEKDHTAFRGGADNDNGWTGIGYKRKAAVGAQNGGTPGYPHGSKKADGADATAAVMISEIMYAVTDRTLLQWIELRNMSDTVGVDLDKWELLIVNHKEMMDDMGMMKSFPDMYSQTVNLSGRIPPGQSYLIASSITTGRRDSTNLPKNRIKSAGKKHNEMLLNPYGFQLTIRTKRDKGAAERETVDMVGNLKPAPAGNRRADAQSFNDDVAWKLPADVIDEDGSRVSVVRVPGVKDNKGTIAGAWALYTMTREYDQIRNLTYYGNEDDISSPGHHHGGVLPVSLSKFRPERMKDTGAVVIRWITESELNNAGFNILRSETRDGAFTKLNTKLIAGQGTTSERTTYEYADTSAKPNVVYYYQIQDVSLEGQVSHLATTHLRGNVTAAGKLTTTWGELKLQD
ncbi:MAG: hypothetical protein OXH00_09655 [Candidatus Poribacteria bacterium]|nr:hypothetical protein [Candidatus Poribacteria bacterium]